MELTEAQMVALSDTAKAAAPSGPADVNKIVVALVIVLVVSTDRGFSLSTVYGQQGPALQPATVTS